MKIKLIICVIPLLTTGCALLGQESRINYTETLDAGSDSPSLITDAKQRVIINTKAKVGVGNVNYDENGRPKSGDTGDTGDMVVKNHPSRIICAEPSPDVGQAISSAISIAGKGDFKGQGSASGSMDSSYASSIAQLGERLVTVQLLRDKMYRACEAFQNGAISDTSYTLMLARFDRTMASMLATETAAGAFGRSLAALGGSASTVGGDPKKPADPADPSKVKENPHSDPAKSPAPAGAKSTGAQSGPPEAGFTGFGQIAGRSAIDANVIERINANFLSDDASGTLIDACVIALDRNRKNGDFDKINKRIVKAERKVKKATDEGSANHLASARSEYNDAEDDLEVLQRRPRSLADLCMDMLGKASSDDNLLIRLQEEKQKGNATAITIQLEQMKANTAAAQMQNCIKVTKDLKVTDLADKYNACMSIKPKGPIQSGTIPGIENGSSKSGKLSTGQGSSAGKQGGSATGQCTHNKKGSSTESHKKPGSESSGQ
ncbi:MAG: hypothetical protein ABIN99_02565 [Nitrosospira sp.]